MITDIKSMFDSIKESLNDEKKGGGGGRHLLRLKQGNTYLVRLIPNVKDPKTTFFHYHHHGWTSRSTGQYVDGICPSTWGESCPICTERFKLYNTGKENNRELAKLIRRLDKHFVNVYVVDDPDNPDNNGTVKVLRHGVRIKEKFDAATVGDDADEFGSRVYDLSENGCNFKIKVETTQEGNKKFTNYNNSRFTAPTSINGMTPEKIQEVYEQCHELATLIDRPSTDELKKLLKIHLFNESSSSSKPSRQEVLDEVTESVIEFDVAETTDQGNSETDNKIQDLLEGLDELGDD